MGTRNSKDLVEDIETKLKEYVKYDKFNKRIVETINTSTKIIKTLQNHIYKMYLKTSNLKDINDVKDINNVKDINDVNLQNINNVKDINYVNLKNINNVKDINDVKGSVADPLHLQTNRKQEYRKH